MKRSCITSTAIALAALSLCSCANAGSSASSASTAAAETAAAEETQATESSEEALASELSTQLATQEEEEATADTQAAIDERNKTIYFSLDGTNLYLDETLQDVAATGLSFTYHDSATNTDIPVDEAFCNTAYTRGNLNITATDSSGNPVIVSLWNKWLDETPDTYGDLNVMNIGIAEPAPVAWSQASLGPYGIYIGMSSSDLTAAAGKPESNTEFVSSNTWLYSTMLVSRCRTGSRRRGMPAMFLIDDAANEIALKSASGYVILRRGGEVTFPSPAEDGPTDLLVLNLNSAREYDAQNKTRVLSGAFTFHEYNAYHQCLYEGSIGTEDAAVILSTGTLIDMSDSCLVLVNLTEEEAFRLLRKAALDHRSSVRGKTDQEALRTFLRYADEKCGIAPEPEKKGGFLSLFRRKKG